jgi:two-component system nitrate/nitrite response regulator NarL
MIGVFVVSPIALLCEGLSALLATLEGIDVIGTASDVLHAANQLRGSDPLPDVILFDMSWPEADGAARWLLEELPGARLLAIAVPNRNYELVACAEIGVAGFVTCESSLDELLRSVEAACRHELICTPAVAAALLRRLATVAHDQRSTPSVLTRREQEILALLGEGLTNKQIADRLYIALPTVRNHVHNILGKLNLHRRAEAAALFARTELPPAS